MLPLVASNALILHIVITPSHNIRLTDCHTYPSNTVQQDCFSYVVLQLQHQHYSGTALNRLVTTARPHLTMERTDCHLPSTSASAVADKPTLLKSSQAADALQTACITTVMVAHPSLTPVSTIISRNTSKLLCFPLHVAHLSIRRLLGNSKRDADSLNKLDELRLRLSEKDTPHIFCLNETWLSDKIDSWEIEIDNYHVIRRDRKHGERGGVAIYISQSFKDAVVSVDSKRYHNLETCVLEVFLQYAKALLVCNVYRTSSCQSD